ncbi:MAG: crossover junction endodeoxyribonuclease RuvC [Pseudomonadales bacterium]|nr:crossover junction endodeoxyribonuclease RuvC [Pseudomonadales bacterium]
MAIILGIDPGSRKTGFGIISTHGDQYDYIASGVINVAKFEFSERLLRIYESVREITEKYSPEILTIEQVFMGKNANSALKLGQARGAAIVAAMQGGLTFAEYMPTEIKQAVVGTGAAKKEQVQHMVTQILKLSATPQEDAADALAAAICHAHTVHTLIRNSGTRTQKVSSWRQFKPEEKS